MLGGAALSEQSIAEASVANVSVSAPGNVFAVGLATGAGSVAASAVSSVNAVSAVAGSGRVDRESSAAGMACSSAEANAVGRVDFGDVVVLARTRVLPMPSAASAVLPLLAGALTVVRADRVAHSSVLPLTVTVTTHVAHDPRAASRVVID
jgi:hypothetical protein